MYKYSNNQSNMTGQRSGKLNQSNMTGLRNDTNAFNAIESIPVIGGGNVSNMQKTNPLALVAFFLSFCGLSLFGLIIGIIALKQINEKNEGGKGLAIAAIVIGGIITFFIIVIIGLVVVFLVYKDNIKEERIEPIENENPIVVDKCLEAKCSFSCNSGEMCKCTYVNEDGISEIIECQID